MTTPLQALREHGQSPWIDFIARDFVRGGELERLIDRGIVGLTSNPTIFQQAIAEGNAYDDQLREVMRELEDPREVFFRLAVEDIKEACDKLRPVFDRGESTRDGWVSMEVDPDLASDAQATLKEAKRIHGEIGKPNLFVKIPGTKAGLQAIEETIAAGIPVNVTLLFSLERHRLAAEAYLRGLRRLRESGGDLSTVASVASFFVSRVDSEADKRIEEKGAPAELKGKLAIANAKLAYQTYLDLFSGSDWEDLATSGASPQRCLWASTSTKNPDYRDVIYVEELIGEHTVNTMPPKTADAFDDHGQVEDTLERGVEEARETLKRFADAGIDYDDVVETLEREGVQKFADSFRELIEGVAAKRDELVAA